jgi:hypothetical protein
MKIVKISEAQPGCVLAKDLRDPAGSLMLAKGGVVSEGLLNSLKRKNISEIAIESEDETGEQAVQARLEALKNRFEGHGPNPFMKELERIIREHIERTAKPPEKVQ